MSIYKELKYKNKVYLKQELEKFGLSTEGTAVVLKRRLSKFIKEKKQLKTKVKKTQEEITTMSFPTTTANTESIAQDNDSLIALDETLFPTSTTEGSILSSTMIQTPVSSTVVSTSTATTTAAVDSRYVSSTSQDLCGVTFTQHMPAQTSTTVTTTTASTGFTSEFQSGVRTTVPAQFELTRPVTTPKESTQTTFAPPHRQYSCYGYMPPVQPPFIPGVPLYDRDPRAYQVPAYEPLNYSSAGPSRYTAGANIPHSFPEYRQPSTSSQFNIPYGQPSETDYNPRRPKIENMGDVMDKIRKWNVKFDKGQDVLSFLERVEELSSCYGISGEMLLIGLPEMLQKSALMWYRNNKERWHSWEQFVIDFKSHFLPPRYELRLYDDIRSRIQKPNEKAKDFIDGIQSLMRWHRNMTESEKLNRIYENLLAEYKLYIKPRDFITLDELEHLCEEYEFIRQQEKKNQTKAEGVKSKISYGGAYTVCTADVEKDLVEISTPKNAKLSNENRSINNRKLLSFNAKRNTSKDNSDFIEHQVRSNHLEYNHQGEKIYSQRNCCWRCGQKGHTRRGCLNKPKYFCYYCGKDGVLAKDCTCRRRTQNSNAAVLQNNNQVNQNATQTISMEESVVSTVYQFDKYLKYVLPIKILNAEFTAVVDTGAVKSFIGKDIHDYLQVHKVKFRKCNVPTQLADGSILHINTSYKLVIQLANKKVIHTFYYMPGLNENILIGLELLQRIGAKLSIQGEELQLCKVNPAEVVYSVDAQTELPRHNVVEHYKCTWYNNKVEDVIERPESNPDFIIKDGKLYRRFLNTAKDNKEPGWKLCVPTEQRKKILREIHEEVDTGHLGTSKMITRMVKHYYWPRMFKDIKRFVRTCESCVNNKVIQQAVTENMKYERKPKLSQSLYGKHVRGQDILDPGPYNRNSKRAPQSNDHGYNLQKKSWHPRIGDLVYRRVRSFFSKMKNDYRKLSAKYEGPFKVVDFISPLIVKLEMQPQNFETAHIKYLTPFNE